MNRQAERSTTAAAGAQAGLDHLARLVAERRVILFAGAGLSMAVGLPSWSELVEHMCRELGLDSAGFDNAGSYQALAEYYRIERGGLTPLADWLRRNWQVSDEAVRASEIHRLIVELDFPIVYTTNYDANLEKAYELHGRSFARIGNARDLARSTDDATPIVKFHGDLEDEGSLVLAESDYFARLRFESPMDIKFRADALGRSVLFLGYSMSDMNIRLLLYRLWQIWQGSGAEAQRPPSFLFTSRPDPVQEALLAARGIRILTGETENPQQALLGFLSDLAGRVGRLGGVFSLHASSS
jgi:hypothetical protein